MIEVSKIWAEALTDLGGAALVAWVGVRVFHGLVMLMMNRGGR